MIELIKIYVMPCLESNILPPQDVKLLFGNVHKIIDVSSQFLLLLQDAMAMPEKLVGLAFLEMVLCLLRR